MCIEKVIRFKSGKRESSGHIGFTMCLAAFTLFSVPFAFGAVPGAAPSAAGGRSADVSLSPAQRGELAKEFVLRWGAHVESVYDLRVDVWAERMVNTFVVADPSNLRAALDRRSFEGAMAELSGRGDRLSDERAILRLAEAAEGELSEIGAKALGDVTADLTFTPLQPCRIVDTRSAIDGAIAANSARSFSAQAASFTSQGGNSSDCGLAAVTQVGAIAVNITAVTPNTAGFATVYAFGTTRPLASSVNYTQGAIVNNAIITRVPSPAQSQDFTIYTFAQSHFVVDLVGYFAPPQATPLQCTNTSLSTFLVPANTSTFFLNPQCPVGYRPVTPYCYSGTPGVSHQGSGLAGNLAGNQDTFCGWFNETSSPQSVLGGNVCCRIPGR